MGFQPLISVLAQESPSPDALVSATHNDPRQRRMAGPGFSIRAIGYGKGRPIGVAFLDLELLRFCPVDFGTPFERITMTRGGRRRRFIMRGETGVWRPAGPWGPRRTRTSECGRRCAQKMCLPLPSVTVRQWRNQEREVASRGCRRVARYP